MSELIPFDLEAAKRGEPVVCRNGRKARIICFDCNSAQPIIAIFQYEDGSEDYSCFTNDGSYYTDEESGQDLFMAPKPPKKLWIGVLKNSHKNGGHSTTCDAYTKPELLIKNVIDPGEYYILQIEVPCE